MMRFVELTAVPEDFFTLLPPDWREEIEPVWPEYVHVSRIFGLLSDAGEVMAGGIVFGKVSPDTQGYAEVAQSYFDAGRRYIGFVYVLEDQRGKGLGSEWLIRLKSTWPDQPFWLAVVDENLRNFYEPLGFTVVQEVQNEGEKEWILVD